MKKLFSLLIAFLVVISLSACTEDLQPKVTELETQIATLEAQIATLEGEKDTLETSLQDEEDSNDDLTAAVATANTSIEELQTEIAALQAKIYDNVVTLSISYEDGSVSSKTAAFNDEFEGSLFDLLTDTYTVGAYDSEYGHYLYQVEDLHPLNGAYIAFSKNDEMAMVGVDDITFTNGDEFQFEISWYDMTEKAVYDAINVFLEQQAGEYVNDQAVNYHVIAGLHILGVVDEYATTQELSALVDLMPKTTNKEYFKAIVTAESAGLYLSTLYADFNEIVATGGWGATSYGLQALYANEHSTDFSSYDAAALTYLLANEPKDAGINSGAIDMIALSNYTDNEDVNTLVADWVDMVKANQLQTGGVQDLDFGWGQSEDASTIAQAILGLVAADVDPTSEDFTKDSDMVARLVEYQLEDGSFYWHIGDCDANTAFSTPQAFLALVAYQAYSNSGTAVNPYSFNE